MAEDEYLYLKSGAAQLDKALGGGWERGSGAFIYGRKASGKSRICLSTAINCIKKKEKIYWNDTEESLTTAQLIPILRANSINIPDIKVPAASTDAERTKYFEIRLRKELQDQGLLLVKTHNFLETWNGLAELCRKIANKETFYDLIVIDSVTAQYVGYLMQRKMEAMIQSRGDWQQKQSAGRKAMFTAVSDCQAFMVAIINDLHQLAGQEKFVILMTGQPKSEVSDALRGGVGEAAADTAAGEGGDYTGGKAVEFPPKTVIHLKEQQNEIKMAIIESHRNVKPGQVAIFKTTDAGVQ